MSTMKKLIESVDAGIANEGPMGMPMASPMPPEDKGNPVSVNVSMNASGKEHVADLLDMMKNAGLDGAEEVSGPSLSPRMDMEKFRDIIDTDGDNMPSPEADVDEITKQQMEADNTMNSILAKWIDHYNSDIGSDGAGAAMQEIIDDLNQDNGLISDDYPELQKFAEKLDGGWEIVDEKVPGSTSEEQLNTLVKTINDDQYITSLFKQQTDQWDFGTDEEKEGKTDEWANSAPGEEASDRGDMGDYEDNIRDGDDLHAKKNRKAIRTVNPALENIKKTLYKALAEKKAKPDFLDMDKDGDKKEPMKKAIKDKKSKKESVEEGAFKKAGAKGDGSAKFDEMGCKKEMMKLNQSGCAKHEMYQKVGEKYGCSKANFEKLYASHCG